MVDKDAHTFVATFASTISDLLREIQYFIYLLDIHEIRDENILRYYIPQLDSTITKMQVWFDFNKALEVSDPLNILLRDMLGRVNQTKRFNESLVK